MTVSVLHIKEPPKQGQWALWELGFRPFFLLASLYAVVAVGLWLGVYFAAWDLVPAAMPASYWHAHEMVFGFGMAVVAGFLLTVVKNWTHIQTIQDRPLALLAALWLVARLLFLLQAPWWAMLTIDGLFATALLVAMGWPLYQVRDWNNLSIFASKVALLGLANGLFYLGMAGVVADGMRMGLYSALYVLVALIFTMGRRVIPFFIEKGIGYPVQLRNSKVIDLTSLVGLLGLWLAELFVPASAWTIGFALLTALAQIVRLAWWHRPGIWRKPMLWVLWAGLAWVTLGLLLKAWSEWQGLPAYVAWHAIAYGGVGMVTLGMMSRASLGHTGRNVFEPPPMLAWLYAGLMLGTAIRSLGPILLPDFYAAVILSSQIVWMVVFGLFFASFLTIWLKPSQ
jgi:uncharacterized protein involved in response to NO